MKYLLGFLMSLFAATAAADVLTFITVTAAGSLSDTAIRQAAPAIEKHTGKAVVVVNMPGANGLVGMRHFMAQPADGKTLLVGNSAIGYLLETKQIHVAPIPVFGLAKTEMAVYTHVSVPSLAALIKKTDLKAGSTSPMTELSIRLFDDTHKVKTKSVGYKQFGQAVIDLAAGRIEYLIAPAGVSAIESMVASNKIHKVASIGSQFTWNAVFSLPGAASDELRLKLSKAILDTVFFGVQPFVAGPSEVKTIQNNEASLIRKALAFQDKY